MRRRSRRSSEQNARGPGIISRADSLIVSTVYGETNAPEFPTFRLRARCAGTTCTITEPGTGYRDTLRLSDLYFETVPSDELGTKHGITLIRWSGRQEGADFRGLGAWMHHSGFVAQEGSLIVEGIAADGRYGLAGGDLTETRPEGSATWLGLMVGTPATGNSRGDLLLGDAALNYDLSVGALDVAFSSIKNIDRGTAHETEAVLFADVPMTDGGTFQAGLAGNRIQGGFYGPGHAEAAGDVRAVEHRRRVRGQAPVRDSAADARAAGKGRASLRQAVPTATLKTAVRNPVLTLVAALLASGCGLVGHDREPVDEKKDRITYERNSTFTGPRMEVFVRFDDGRRATVNSLDDAIATRPANAPIPGHQARDWTFLKETEHGTSVAFAVTSWDPANPDDYIMAGWWAEFPGQYLPDLDVNQATRYGIVDGPELDTRYPPDLPLEGQATYQGQTGGLYRYLPPGGGIEDILTEEYQGIITLSADFAERTLQGCVGCVGDIVSRREHFNFFLGDEQRFDAGPFIKDYEIHLGAAPLEENGTFGSSRRNGASTRNSRSRAERFRASGAGPCPAHPTRMETPGSLQASLSGDSRATAEAGDRSSDLSSR